MRIFFSLILAVLAYSSSLMFATSDILSDTTRKLTSYNDQTAQGTLSFDGSKMYSKFCNNVAQPYTYQDGKLSSTGPGMSTLMYCEGLPMTLEQNFIIDTGTVAIIKNNTLTITTSDKNVFVFSHDLITLDDLSHQCIQAFNTCSNMCNREPGTSQRTCTEMACFQAHDAQCIMTSDDEPISACTMEYNPVCGQPAMPICPIGMECVQMMPLPQTYSSQCMLAAAKATLLYEGVCDSDEVIVGGDKDEHGCIGSAGYSRGTGLQQCIRTREQEGVIDFAIIHGITSMKTVKMFRADDIVTRQEAAKMIVTFAENLYNKSYASFPNNCNRRYKDDKKITSGLKSSVYDACALGLMHGRKGSFHPYTGLTRGQALMVLIKIVVGEQSPTHPYYLSYADKAHELGLLSFANFTGFDDNITRGELIEWMKTIYENNQQ